MTDAEVKAYLSHFDALWLTLYGEVRSEPVEGQIAVACVIRNRVLMPKRFGDTYAKVCLAKSQFSCWFPYGGQANYDALMQMARLLIGDYAERTTLPHTSAIKQLKYVAQGVMGHDFEDRSMGADHYMTSALWKSKPPLWVKGKKPVTTIGAHVFFKLG